MSRLGAVQRKVPCLFVTQVKEEPSAKRERQVPAGGELVTRVPPPRPAPLRACALGRGRWLLRG